MIGRAGIEHIATDFWEVAGGREAYGQPADVERAVAAGLRIPVVKLPALTFEKADAFLRRIGGPQDAPGGDQKLHGLIVADQDTAIIFVDGNDKDDEQRATIAQEAAHFIWHYREPRQRVRRLLGQLIEDVLSRRRPPTPAERFAAVLRGVPLTCFRCGEPYNRAALVGSAQETEDEADAIALELLAPRRDVQRRRMGDAQWIARNYGIPMRMAQAAAELMGPVRRAPSVVDIFRTRSENR